MDVLEGQKDRGGVTEVAHEGEDPSEQTGLAEAVLGDRRRRCLIHDVGKGPGQLPAGLERKL